jgi:glutaminyl-tRNA synthetase
VKKDGQNVVEILAKHEKLTASNKPKAFIHWVAQPAKGKDPLVAECRLYEQLLKDSEGDVEEKADWLSLVNENSEQILPRVFVEESLANAKVEETFQFERLGYFCVDPDSKNGKLVFNRTVLLKEDTHKV